MLPESFYREVDKGDASTELTLREKLAIDFARRFCVDHESIDDAYFDRLRTGFADDEILDLTVCTARFLSMGRMTRVLRPDHDCPLPAR